MQVSSQCSSPSYAALADAYSLAVSPDRLAGAYLAVIPQLMAFVRKNLNQDPQINLRLGQFRMLHTLHQNLAHTISEVAGVLGVSLPSASKMMDDLENLGWVSRHPDDQDRRRAILSLTDNGQNIYRRAVDSVREQIAEQFASLSTTERGVLFCAAVKLTEIFQSVSPPLPVTGVASTNSQVSPIVEPA